MKPHSRLIHHFIRIATVGACVAACNANAWGAKLLKSPASTSAYG